MVKILCYLIHVRNSGLVNYVSLLQSFEVSLKGLFDDFLGEE